MPGAAQCKNTEKVPVTVQPLSASGARAELDGDLTVTVQSGDGDVEMTGPLSFNAVSGTELADTVFKLSGDGIKGEEVGIIEDTYTLTVVGENADHLNVVSGAPIPK